MTVYVRAAWPSLLRGRVEPNPDPEPLKETRAGEGRRLTAVGRPVECRVLRRE